MLGIVKAEILKSKRTMGRKLIFIFPLITFIMALLVTGGLQNAYAECVWNWWYIMILPMMISILCYLFITKTIYLISTPSLSNLYLRKRM